VTTAYDVAVLGTGPAGSAAAAAIAEEGHSVALIGPPPSPGPSHTLLLTGSVADHLRAIAPSEAAGARFHDSIHLTTRADAAPANLESPGGTLPDHVLRRTLYHHALARGATAHPALARDVHLTRPGIAAITTNGRLVRARHVVDARGHRPHNTADHPTGTACTLTLDGARGVALPRLVLSIPADTDPGSAPTALWAIPHDDTLTLTAISSASGMHLPSQADAVARELFRTDLPRTSAWTVRRIDHAFRPGISAEHGMIVIGDAAGLINPFTGEGLSHAIDSARHAARAITGNSTDAAAAITHYERALERSFVGYFEASRHAARRRHLAWRIVDAAATSGHPFIAKARRTILLPEGISGAADHMPAAHTDFPGLTGFLLACDEVLASTVRDEWPFLARLLVTGTTGDHPRMRPALLYAAAASLHDAPPDPGTAPLAAAIELASLAALTFTTPPETTRKRGIDWATTTVILAGDYLLSEAARLVSAHAPDYAFTFAEWLDDLVSLRAAARAKPGAHDLFGAIFEFPLRLGAHHATNDPSTGHALRDYGTHFGHAFLHTEEILALTGKRTRLDIDLPTLIRSRTTALTSEEAAHPAAILGRYRQLLDARIGKTKASLHTLPANPAVRLLTDLADQIPPPENH